MNGEKAALRKHFLRLRARMEEAERERLSLFIMRQLKEAELFRRYDRILSYMPLREEADISAVRQLCVENGKAVAYPRVEGEEILFYEVPPEGKLIEGTFHVLEPAVREDESPAEWQDALCLTPGAAFDGYGNRYGYGKGYYDRYFRAHPDVLRVGVCFSSQIYEKRLPTEKNDAAMQYLLTEKGICRCADRE